MNMNEQRIAQSIRQWHERVVELETRYNELSPLIGANPEFLMMAAVWHVTSGYTVKHDWRGNPELVGGSNGGGSIQPRTRQMTACLPGEPQRNIATPKT